MAGYIGGKVAVSAPQQIETKHTITATASQTSIPNVGYTVGAVHVYQNGIRLVDGTDYTATNGSTVTLETGATEGDQIVIVSHGSFETSDTVSKASGGTFAAAMNYPGGAVTGNVAFGDSNKILMGAGSDLQIYHDGGTSFIEDAGTGNLQIKTNGAEIDLFAGSDYMMRAFKDGGVSLYHDNAAKLTTTATGIDVTGAITVGGAALGGGGMEFIASSGAISNAATVDFTSKIDASKYDSYKFFFHSVIPATDGAALVAQLSADNGSSYDSTNGNYHRMLSSGGTTDQMYLQISTTTDNGAGGGYSGEGQLFNAGSSSSNTLLINEGAKFHNSGSAGDFRYTDSGGSYVASTAAHTAIRFLFSSGNIASGEITMFGVVNS